jgi:FAD/FMN-containing dehydrogenase
MKYALNRFNELNAVLEEIVPSSETGFTTVCVVQPITKSTIEKGVANGGNVMGLDHYLDDGNGILFLIILAINGAEAERSAVPKLEAFVREVEAYAESLGLKREWKYLNYAHGSQDAIATFGDEAINKLRAASAKYDPDGVFQNLRASGFKIPQD